MVDETQPNPDAEQTDHDLNQIRTQIEHARESANRETMEPLNSINEGLEALDKGEGDPRPDRIESIEEELLKLQNSSEGETHEHLRRARDHLQAYKENQEFIEE